MDASGRGVDDADAEDRGGREPGAPGGVDPIDDPSAPVTGIVGDGTEAPRTTETWD